MRVCIDFSLYSDYIGFSLFSWILQSLSTVRCCADNPVSPLFEREISWRSWTLHLWWTCSNLLMLPKAEKTYRKQTLWKQGFLLQSVYNITLFHDDTHNPLTIQNHGFWPFPQIIQYRDMWKRLLTPIDFSFFNALVQNKGSTLMFQGEKK